MPETVISVAHVPKTKGDQDKLATASQRLAEEDPTFKVHSDEETGQTIIEGMGELHLEVLVDRMRREFRVNGVYLEGAPMISLFHYDNDSFILYPYLDRETHDTDIFLHVQDAKALTEVVSDKRIEPLYTEAGEAVFRIHAMVGKFRGYHVER